MAPKRKLDALTDADEQTTPAKSTNPPEAASTSTNHANAAESERVPATQRTAAEPSTKVPSHKGKEKATATAEAQEPKHKIRRLAPPRPFPTVPTSVNATGPRSTHHEGKNYIAITRKTQMGGYLRRIKDVVLKDGYRTIHLNALGAAIPHLMRLAVSIPAVLPYAAQEIHTEVLTGTVEVQDEIIPDDEDEDISYQTRGKSTVSVIIKIGDGLDEKLEGGKWSSRGKRGKARMKAVATQNAKNRAVPEKVVVQEPEQDDMDQD
ncbi:hypothetical protein EVG20_g2328 [Dentipellis fragilis]|uniref:Uncharacterized protein n=1 Tax=Dentipellis fragilis TaxID=205917 RepID=A0A4Y9ZA46_9AGAM|nr:hypothetical protein EVG20_g2328 [Dentipellis fragilis]